MKRSTSTLKQVWPLEPILYVRDDDSQMADYLRIATEYSIQLVEQDSTKALGASQTYDSLIDMAIHEGYENLIILDDDLTFSMHNPIQGAKPDFTRCTTEQLCTLLHHFGNLPCAEMPAMSMTPIMKRSQPGLISFAKPLMWTYSFYLPHFKAHPEHRFWVSRETEARCDLNLALRMLTDGFLTAYLTSVFIPDNVNNPGGCSTYRTIELERQSVAYLKAKYPGIVSTYKKLGWVGDASVEREAPVVAWKKAFNHAKFCERFNVLPIDFITEKLEAYEKTYATFIEELRK
jgi:hypothetical protein